MDQQSHAPQILRIPLRQVTAAYGPDGLDMATDDLLFALSQVTGQMNPDCVIDVDVSQRDSRDHVLTIEISGLSSSAMARWRGKLQELGLLESE